MSRRTLVLDAFQKKQVDRVPVGFWFHFAQEKDFKEGPTSPSVIKTNIEGHQKFFDEFQPDFLKLMSDGFFGYPGQEIIDAETAEDLWNVKAIGDDHPWIQAQVALVKELVRRFGKEVVTFYNIFSPLTFFQIIREGNTGKSVADFFHENPDALSHALSEVSKDIKALSVKVVRDGGADGIYFSVKNFQDPSITKEQYLRYVAPGEKEILDAVNQISENHILHICGYEGARNDLRTYTDYNANIINWAVNVENITLEEGRKLFDGKVVLGGFPNSQGSLIETGSKGELEKFTEQILTGAGTIGTVIGADCTIPSHLNLERLEWIRQRAASF